MANKSRNAEDISKNLIKKLSITGIVIIALGLIIFSLSIIFPNNFINFNFNFYNNFNRNKPSNLSRNLATVSKLDLDKVEIAKTSEEIQRGLMFRNQLCEKCGMLFVMPNANVQNFWMKNTLVPLDIIFIGEDYRVVSIAENTTPLSTENIPSEGLAKYVLEVNAGYAKKSGLQKFDFIDVAKYLEDNQPYIFTKP